MDFKDIQKAKFPFEEFLQQVHAKDYIGTDDDMSDDFDAWITNLDPEEIIGYAEQLTRFLLDHLK